MEGGWDALEGFGDREGAGPPSTGTRLIVRAR